MYKRQAVSIAWFVEDAQVIATDISGDALDVARANARKHNLGHRIKFLQGDLLAPLADEGLEHRLTAAVSYTHLDVYKRQEL